MEAYEIEYFESENGAIPFKEWLEALDKKVKSPDTCPVGKGSLRKSR